MRVRAWSKTDVGCIRVHNEDSCITTVNPNISLGLVCDGMGGASAGEIASRLAAETFAEVSMNLAEQPEERLRYALERANQEVYCYGWEHPDCRGMGTTLVACMVIGEDAYILNVGDSRAYSVGKDGIYQITRDHSLVEELVRMGQITPEQARTHPRRNIITRALGTERDVEGDLFIHKAAPGEMILLCSDGLSNELTDQELWEYTIKGDAEMACKRLIDAALVRGAHDNVTAVLLELQSDKER